jgi:hypothetical protein
MTSGIRILKGDEVQKTASGIASINSGDSRTFLIPRDAVTIEDNTSYSDTTVFSGWSVGPTATSQSLCPTN